MERYSKTERLGVIATDSIVTGALNWIFREQPVVDMGIDAQIERVDDGSPTGKLIGLQIKTGSSHFVAKPEGYVYYGDLQHLGYWSNHSLPVVLIAHLPDENQTYWVHVSGSAIKKTKKGWKILIPRENRFDVTAKESLTALFEGTPQQQKLRRLSLDEPLMRHICGGGCVSVGLEDWINKSLGRSSVQVFVYDDNGDETLHQDWFTYHPYSNPKALAEAIFPWASAGIDYDFYDLHGDRNLETSGPTEDDIYPYADAAGEVEYYHLRLELNDVGNAYLTISSYLSDEI